jgi:hypothetical protein
MNQIQNPILEIQWGKQIQKIAQQIQFQFFYFSVYTRQAAVQVVDKIQE